MNPSRFLRLGAVAMVWCWVAASCGSNASNKDAAASGNLSDGAKGAGGAPASGGTMTGSGGSVTGSGGTGAGGDVAGDASIVRTGGVAGQSGGTTVVGLDAAPGAGGAIVATGGNTAASDAGVAPETPVASDTAGKDAGVADAGKDTPIDSTPAKDAGADGSANLPDAKAVFPDRPWPCADAASPTDVLIRPTVTWGGPNVPVDIGGGQIPTSTGTVAPVYAFPGTAIVAHTPMFAGCPDYSIRLDSPGELSFVNLNGDERPDFALKRRPESLAVTNTLSFYVHATLGTAKKLGSIVLARGDYIDTFTVADLDGDGLGEVLLAHHSATGNRESELGIFHQRQDGFSSQPDLALVPSEQGNPVCTAVQDIHVDDVDGDGRSDIVVLTRRTPTYPADGCDRPGARILVYRQDKAGGFAVAQALSPPNVDPDCEYCGLAMALGDVDGDGRKDLAVLSQGLSSSYNGIKGWDTLIYQQTAAGFPEQPTQTLVMPQYLSKIRMADVNGDGRLDVLVRPAKVDDSAISAAIRFGYPSMSGVFLGTQTGTFEAVRTFQVSLGVPFEIWSAQPFGIDLRDVDGDGARDLALNRFNYADSLYIKHRDRFGTTPNAEAASVLAEAIALSEQQFDVLLEESPESSAIGLRGKLNRLGYYMADTDADGREDYVAALAPFAPNSTQDPQTGSYGPSAYFEPNTYTDLRLHLQRSPVRRIAVEIPESRAGADDKILRVQIKLTNLAKTRADNLRVRLLTRSVPMAYHLTPAMLAANYDTYAAEVRDLIVSQTSKVVGNPLGADILVPGIDPGASVLLEAGVPVAFVNDLTGYSLFAVVDPDTATNVLYKTEYDFIR